MLNETTSYKRKCSKTIENKGGRHRTKVGMVSTESASASDESVTLTQTGLRGPTGLSINASPWGLLRSLEVSWGILRSLGVAVGLRGLAGSSIASPSGAENDATWEGLVLFACITGLAAGCCRVTAMRWIRLRRATCGRSCPPFFCTTSSKGN